MNFRYHKEERLKSRKQIGELFKNRKSIGVYPLRIFWTLKPTDNPSLPQIAFSVSKKTFKSAVKRNRYKRLMREVYRLNKHQMLSHLQKHNIDAHFMLIFVGDISHDFQQIEQAFLSLSDKFIKKNKLV